MRYQLAGEEGNWARFDSLEVLVADSRGHSYQRFVSEYNRQVYIYPELAQGTFVFSVHDGTLRASGRELEAEPLRRELEGPLHSTFDLATIEANLQALLGRPFEFQQGDRIARFAVVQARRMSADDVLAYQHRAMELSRFMDPLAQPERSFLWLMCSGRQPDEPREAFPGRFVLVLEQVASQ